PGRLGEPPARAGRRTPLGPVFRKRERRNPMGGRSLTVIRKPVCLCVPLTPRRTRTVYAPLSSLAGSSLPRRGPAARLAAAVIGRAVLLATPVLFLVTGLPLLLTQGDATSRGDGPTHPGGPGLGAA